MESTSDLERSGRWLGATALLDLEDSRLRLRAQSLMQLCANDRARAVAIYDFVKRIPFAKPFKIWPNSARQVLDAGRGDAPDKVTLLLALLRLAQIPCRIHYVEVRGEILRGLTSGVASAARPVAEIWLDGRWVRTDSYIFDAAYMAAARQRLKDLDWEWGYGIHRNGESVWNGADDSYLCGAPAAQDPMVLRVLGVFDDPLAFIMSDAYRGKHPRLVRTMHWNLLAPLMQRAIRGLRADRPADSAP